VVLHAYEKPLDLPEGVELADANQLIPSSKIIRHTKTGSYALFANFLRYELLGKRFGLYVDCDVYCVRPVEDQQYIFGFESKNINGAVLKLPPECATLTRLRGIKDQRPFLPEWVRPGRRRYYKWRARAGVPVKIQDMPWGVAGPRALTWSLKNDGLEHHASPIDDFYPVHFGQTSLLLDPELQLEDLITPRTRLVHLWNEVIKNVDLQQVPSSSPLGTILSS
jgi:hypothetical protein